ncbi:lysis system o-spanin lipoprotein Rz1 [Pseudomonas sp. RHF3.3-3]|uniref:lysis system o-spanin lipoprotein Rz1 n=1 Tax=unclassified Pseudomonas TaxID=196821 RepID=UPI000476AECF
MCNRIRLACVIAWLLPICGCQSSSTAATPPAAVRCLPPPPPAAWFMQPHAPDLTRRMLNELSPSPTTATAP